MKPELEVLGYSRVIRILGCFALLLAVVGSLALSDAEAKAKRTTPKITIDDWGDGTVAGDVISKDYVCGIPGRVVVFKAKGKRPNRKKDRALKSTRVAGSDAGPFWRVDGVPLGTRVYAVFQRNARCNRAVSRTIVTRQGTSRSSTRTFSARELTNRRLYLRMIDLMQLTLNNAPIIEASTITMTPKLGVVRSNSCRGPRGGRMLYSYYEIRKKLDRWIECPPKSRIYKYLKKHGRQHLFDVKGPFVIRYERPHTVKDKAEFMREYTLRNFGNLMATKARIDPKSVGEVDKVRVTKRFASVKFDLPEGTTAEAPVARIVLKAGKLALYRFPAP